MTVSRPNAGAPWTDDEAREAQRMRDAGLSLAEVAARLGRTERAIKVKTRRPVSERGKPLPLTDEEYAEIARLWDEGLALREIGRRLSRCNAAIRGARDRLGLPKRDPKPAAPAAPAATVGYQPLAPELGIIVYRDRSGVSLSAGIRTAGLALPPA